MFRIIPLHRRRSRAISYRFSITTIIFGQLWSRCSYEMSENDKKRNKPDDTNTSPIQDISNRDLAKLIAEQTKTTKQQFNQLGEELRNELKQGLMGINQELRDVRSSLEQIKLDVMDNTEAIARTERSSDLIVSGVPYTREEDLYSYFRHWCLALGYTQHSVPSVDIRRLTRVPLNDGNNCLILLQFAIPNQKNDFYSKYLRSHSLTLRQVGFQTDSRVYVNESLTPSARKIKAKAMELKKEGKLASVFSRSGVIHVKAASSDQSLQIKTTEDLQRFQRQLPLSK